MNANPPVQYTFFARHFCTSLCPSIMIRLTVNARLSAHTVRMLWHPLADALIAKWVGISSVSDRNFTKHIYFHCPVSRYVTEIHTHTRLTALCPGLPRWAGTRKLKPNWILVKQKTVSGSGISWAIYKSAPRSRQITMPAPHHSSVFTGRMPFLTPNQQRQSTEGTM